MTEQVEVQSFRDRVKQSIDTAELRWQDSMFPRSRGRTDMHPDLRQELIGQLTRDLVTPEVQDAGLRAELQQREQIIAELREVADKQLVRIEDGRRALDEAVGMLENVRKAIEKADQNAMGIVMSPDGTVIGYQVTPGSWDRILDAVRE